MGCTSDAAMDTSCRCHPSHVFTGAAGSAAGKDAY